MFTGIITDLGVVKAIEPMAQGVRMRMQTAYDMDAIALGASIAHDGACLSVVQKAAGWFEVEISPETLDKTTLGQWQVGRAVNLERPVSVGGEFGGHMVTGHVDAIGQVQRFKHEGDFWLLEVKFPASMHGYVAAKGSVCINGVSLTVNTVDGDSMQLMIIPHTAQQTNIGQLNAGASVNLEIDLVARYVASLLGAGQLPVVST